MILLNVIIEIAETHVTNCPWFHLK